MTTLTTYWRARPALLFMLIAVAITALRIIALFVSSADLGQDEAQYWAWSREPAFGYFSKPPFIAWTIAATTALFGNAEWAVRLAAPFLHLGAALFVFALGRRLYGPAIGFWSGVGWLTLPGATLSSMLITTDAPLLFFWCAGLYFFFRLAEARRSNEPAIAFALLAGAAVGFGLLSKYAMIYFPLGAALALVFAPSLRRRLKPVDIAAAAAVALLLVAPNIAWNAANDFQTLSHTAANANWRSVPFHPLKLAEFLGAQFGVFGPILFALLLWGVATLARRLAAAAERREIDIALLCFALPPLAIVSIQAFISRAHANWAAAAFPAALLLVTAWALRARLGGAVKASAALHVAAGAVLFAAMANFALVDALGLSNAVKSVRGWPAQIADVERAGAGYDALLADERDVMGALLYYGRSDAAVYALDSNHRVDHHYEAFMAYDPARARRLLFVTRLDSPRALQDRFANIAPRGVIAADLGGGKERRLYLFEASGPLEAPTAPGDK